MTVLDKPGKPEGPLKISDIHKEGCSLKWNPPEDDGGAPIDYYMVEKMETDTGKVLMLILMLYLYKYSCMWQKKSFKER